jgi:hypothetical protein
MLEVDRLLPESCLHEHPTSLKNAFGMQYLPSKRPGPLFIRLVYSGVVVQTRTPQKASIKFSIKLGSGAIKLLCMEQTGYTHV